MSSNVPALVAAAMLLLATSAAPSMAQTHFKNWGQEVKNCNQTNCYPGGTRRGAYVREQARDAEGPGYGYEIHKFAKPGKSQAIPGGGNKKALRMNKRK
jgi:hypothetical protein